MTVRAILDRVIVEPLEPKELKVGKILLTKRSGKPQIKGKIVSIGPGYSHPNGYFAATTAKAGQIIMFNKELVAENEIEVDGVKLYVMSEQQIICIVDAE